MKVLLSIKPQFVDSIINGEKKFEYRKKIFKKEINTIVVYSTLPEGKIVGEFTVNKIIKENPNDLWEMTKQSSGISKEFFLEYFKDREYGYALEIKDFTLYKKPIDPKKDLLNFIAPQSFSYVDESYSSIRKF